MQGFCVNMWNILDFSDPLHSPARDPVDMESGPGASSFFFFWLRWVFFIAAAQAFSKLLRAGATLCCGAWASHCGGFSCCGAGALGARASVVVARGLSSCGARA